LVVAFGLLVGCALGIRVLGVLLFAYAAFVVVIHAPIFGAETLRAKSWRETLDFFPPSALRFLPALSIS